jgi:Aspartate/ornithine carbamoyltransferase, Asp/Orn binding domain
LDGNWPAHRAVLVTRSGAPMTRAIALLVFISWTFIVPSVAGAQDGPQDKPDEKTQERPTGLPSRITWTFNFDAGWGTFGFANSLGDMRNTMSHSLMIVGCLMGMDVRICGPRALWPTDEFTSVARGLQEKTGARLTITDEVAKAVKGADFIHTDVWVSMGEPKDVWKERINQLRPYQVNFFRDVIKCSGNPHVKFLHCLPAFHDTRTSVGRQIAKDFGLVNGVEVTDDVFESELNLAFEQAENRMHTIKAILVATLGD